MVALFYLDLHNGGGILEDRDGRQLADADAAIESAKAEIRELAAADIAEGRPVALSHHIIVRDQHREEIARVRFGDAIELRP